MNARDGYHNPEARKQIALLVRRFSARRLTNDENEDALDQVPLEDFSVNKAHSLMWVQYSDLYTHRLDGIHRLTPHKKRIMARAILLLRSGSRWSKQGFGRSGEPRRHRLAAWMFGVFVVALALAVAAVHLDLVKPLGLLLTGLLLVVIFVSTLRGWCRAWQRSHIERDPQRIAEYLASIDASVRAEDDGYWPFRSPEDLALACRRPPFLNGTGTAG